MTLRFAPPVLESRPPITDAELAGAPRVLGDLYPRADVTHAAWQSTAPSRHPMLLQDLLPDPAALEAPFAALAAERDERPDEPATALVLGFRDPSGGVVFRGRLVFHEDDEPHAFVLGSHPACDCGPLPGALSRHVVVILRGPEVGRISPRADLFAVHARTGFDLPAGGRVSCVPEREGRLGLDGTPLSLAFGEVIAWVVQVGRGEPLRAPYTPEPPQTPGMRAAALEAVRVQKAVEQALREAGVDPGASSRYQHALDQCAELEASLYAHTLPGQEGLRAPENPSAEEAPRLEPTFVGLLDELAIAGAGRATDAELDVWVARNEWDDFILLGRAAPPRVSAGMQAHPEISREHAAIVPLSEELWIVDLASTHGTFVQRIGAPDVQLGGAQRMARLRAGDELWLGEHPLNLRRG